MNPSKIRDEDYLYFIIATPHIATATEKIHFADKTFKQVL